jgi:hypothetical protein
MIDVAYAAGGVPKVSVVRPQLTMPTGRTAIPHMYGQAYLCLYYPGLREWTPEKSIASTIVPWTSYWLYNYEVWLVTDTWEGGGIDHAQPKEL